MSINDTNTADAPAEDAPQAVPESVTVTLKHPVEKRSKTSGEVLVNLETLTIRKPKTRDMRAIDAVTGDVGRTLSLASRLSGEPVALLEEMEIEDFIQVAEAVASFLPNGLKTGPI